MDTAVNWVSENAMVATVSDGGVVTARMNGQATIVAVSGNMTARAAVTVMQTAASIAVRTEPPALDALGQTFQLHATVFDANDRPIADSPIDWTSSDSMVVSVDVKGLVTAQGNGTADVTAASGEASASTVVTVSQVPVRAVVTPDSTILTSVDQTLQMVAFVLDRNGFSVPGIVFSWSSSDPEVAVIGSSGQVTARLNGTTRITAVSDEFTVYSEIEVRITSPHLASLVSLYQYTAGPDWLNSAHWLSDALVDDWHGVTADRMSRVTEIDLTNNYLQRTLPAEVADIGSLRILVLTDNDFLSGPLQKAFTRLDLDVLHLDGTSMCVPADAAFQNWLRRIPDVRADTCNSPRRDWDALTALYNGTTGPNWDTNYNWLTNAPLDSWFGVFTDKNGNVDLLILYENNLDGELPPEIGQFDKIRWLLLQHNELSGPIPLELWYLDQLSIIDLCCNDLTGSIPSEIKKLAKLEDLNLTRNDLTGIIPPELGMLDQLQVLALGENRLTGNLPKEIGRLSNLEWLYAHTNDLTGTIPAELGMLSQLTILSLHKNRFSGSIPAELVQLKNISVFNLGNNRLSGSIPAGLGDLNDLRWFDVSDNPDLEGPLPRSFLNLDLKGLKLQGTGVCIPTDNAFVEWLGEIEDYDAVYCDVPVR